MKLIAILLAAATATAAAQAAPIPIEQFFQKPQMTGASISPDGRHVALRMQSPSGRSMLNVLDVATREQKAVANFRNADVGVFFWQSDMRLAYTVINVDHGGDIGETGLYAVDRDGKEFAVLSPTVVPQRSFADSDYANNEYLARPTLNGFLPRKADTMYVVARFPDDTVLMRINTRVNGRMSDVRAPRGTHRWLVDADGEVRVAVARRHGKDTVYYLEDNNWRELASFDPLSPEAFEPLLYADGKLYVRAHHGRDEASVYRFDLDKKALDSTPLVTAPGFDADGYFQLSDSKMLGFRTNTDSENTVWFDTTMTAIQQEIDALLPNTINTLSYGGHSATASVLVDAHSDVQDHIYLLYNRDTKKLLRLGDAHPDLKAEQMAPMAMDRYPARDGLRIPLYFTVPEPAVKRPRPTVVLVGDPQWKRSSSWAWNEEVQFLAARGYVVLQPQPRGTPGFGRAFEAAGDKQWGRAMQDDIADAVKWSVAQGYTDPARVCIAGTGYGGYAAMMGLIRDPALFKCGVSWSGMTDIGAMFDRSWKDVAEERGLAQLQARVGDPKLDAAQFRETSPLHNAARITQPVLLAYGKEDARVPFHEGRKFRDALAAANQQVEWLEYTPNVEDWKTQANRIDLWRHIEAFLAKHIGP
ncbi:alpha/beta hydrolase family protein [Duganella levis]|uniref:Prolyl oligopeptidase family serine peptidase n=1 Tax=Duganella levis TaxID=2692169 RepID=A0ABW9WAG7_9BURK|nr:prolyl oligopeptidase family serine peptidase [Duganella levis]MYN30627.1 prolyl oligopeptidase family serine peptidase [Duganella levis]